MKHIPLSQGKFAIVDDEDYNDLNQWKWSATKNGSTFYAMRVIVLPGSSKKTLLMHRVILNAPPGAKSDHRDGNGLHNLRDNLRLCNHAENMRNRRKQKNNTSGYRGVSWHNERHRWRVQSKYNGKTKHIGYFFCLLKAAKAYDATIKELFGEFARLNFP